MNQLDYFETNFHLLEKLFPKNADSSKNRLREILMLTESLWQKNIGRFERNPVKYILLAEAPPWTGLAETPKYFYNSISSPFHGRIWNAVYPNQSRPEDREKYFQMLIEKGFLLVDSIPYAMKYKTRHRKKDYYQKIVIQSLSWWQSKLGAVKLNADTKIAFAFQYNGQAIIDACDGIIELQNLKFEVDRNLIAIDGSNYPSPNLLREIYGI